MGHLRCSETSVHVIQGCTNKPGEGGNCVIIISRVANFVAGTKLKNWWSSTKANITSSMESTTMSDMHMTRLCKPLFSGRWREVDLVKEFHGWWGSKV
jgi:hypothetical protein